MSIRCEAIVEKGLLRPLVDLGLPDAERVTLTIEAIAEPRPASSPVKERLMAAGLSHLSIAEASLLSGCDVAGISVEEINRTLPLKTRGKLLSTAVAEERGEGW